MFNNDDFSDSFQTSPEETIEQQAEHIRALESEVAGLNEALSVLRAFIGQHGLLDAVFEKPLVTKPVDQMTRQEIFEANKTVAQRTKKHARNADAIPMPSYEDQVKAYQDENAERIESNPSLTRLFLTMEQLKEELNKAK